MLSEAVEYRRMAGFFTSTSLSVASRGIIGLVENDGIMRIVTSPKLTSADIKIIKDATQNPEKFLESKYFEELSGIDNGFIRNHIALLGWLIANKKLEIRIVIPNLSEIYNENELNEIFHPKVGVLIDKEGNLLSFSGSVNESGKAWLGNFEEFKIFRGWEDVEKEYLSDDIDKFEKLWNNNSFRFKTYLLPEAIVNKLIELAPSDYRTLDIHEVYKQHKQSKKIQLYEHQKYAINKWLDSNCHGIFEMATGTGKTLAAIGCINKALSKSDTLLTIIASPYHHISNQWEKEIESFGLKKDSLINADSTNPTWTDQLADGLCNLVLGYRKHIIVLTTHKTFASDKFIQILNTNVDFLNILVIADEVHGLGSFKGRNSFQEKYNMRLGLSATPKRFFDDLGTQKIFQFFGDVVFAFSLEQALTEINPTTGKTYLTPFNYYFTVVSLDDDELEDYIELSTKIVRVLNATKDEAHEHSVSNLDLLYFKRANIIKNAKAKYKVLDDYLFKTKDTINRSLIYCSPQQIDDVMKYVNKYHITAHRFTMEEGTKPEIKYGNISEREYILDEFSKETYKVLVAMKCLDEGVDIPPAQNAFITASSGNPREYIQRIGRVIRRHEGKNEANIHDILVFPNFCRMEKEVKDFEKKIMKKEIERCEMILQNAKNNIEVYNKLLKLKRELLEY